LVPIQAKEYRIERDKPKIVVVGSSNMDLVARSPRIPVTGETILGGDFIMTPGGKGANQAVAAARLGASLAGFKETGINTDYVTQTADASSGVALITVDDEGNNAIVVAPGANGRLTRDDVETARSVIASAGALVVQLEVPLDTVEYAVAAAHDHHVPVVMDPAPACELGWDLLAKLDVITPNETEAQIVTGVEVTDVDSARAACKSLLERNVRAVALTMGSKGFLAACDEGLEFVEAVEVDALDTTAAGDAFAGALAVGLANGQSFLEAADFAGYVAALSVTKMGAQASMPSRQEVEAFRQECTQGE